MENLELKLEMFKTAIENKVDMALYFEHELKHREKL